MEILSSSPRVLGWMAKEMAGSGNLMAGRITGCASSQSVSPVRVSLSLATTPISPGPSVSTMLLGLTLQPADVAHPLLDPLGALSTWLSALSVPEQTRKMESLPTCGSDTVLNTTAENGAFGSGARVAAALLLASTPSTAPCSIGDGEFLHDEVHQRLNPDAPRGRRGEHGHERALADGLAQRRQHLAFRDRALLQVLREQVVVGLGGGLGQLLAPLLDGIHHLAGDLRLAGLAVRDEERLHLHEIHHTLEARLAADRHLERAQPPLEPALQ